MAASRGNTPNCRPSSGRQAESRTGRRLPGSDRDPEPPSRTGRVASEGQLQTSVPKPPRHVEVGFILKNAGTLINFIGFTLAIISLWPQTRVFQTHVAMDIFKRYEMISGAMPDRLRLADYHEDLSPISEEEWKKITRSMLQYGNLCSEEFALRQKKRVSRDICSLWENSVKENFESQIWREAWQRVVIEYPSYKPFVSFMGN
jgi:hypothetical protein